MRVFVTLALVLVSHQVLCFALPKKPSHQHHHHHHEGHRRHDKKSKTPTNKETSTGNILSKVSQKLGLSGNAPLFPNIFGSQEPAKSPKNIKTKTKTTTKFNGPFKTVTKVTQEFETDKNNKTHLVGQSVQSVTSQNSTNGTVMAKQHHGPGVFQMDFNPFGFSLFESEPERECDEKKPCKDKGSYCDKIEWECKALVKPGKKCYQPGQCDGGKNGNYACVWGTCALTTKTGDGGTFCKKDSDCIASYDMRCAPQEDVSEFSNICVPKPGKDETCGRRSMFEFFSVKKSLHSSPCKKGFACVEVGNFGRKICRDKSLLKDQKIYE